MNRRDYCVPNGPLGAHFDPRDVRQWGKAQLARRGARNELSVDILHVPGFLTDQKLWTFEAGHAHIWIFRAHFGRCDHTSTNAPDPIRTPQLSVLGRE